MIASMLEEMARGAQCVVGFEANGGFLLGSVITRSGAKAPLLPLPTRDAVLPILTCLVEARNRKKTLSGLVGSLPQRFTASGLLREFPVEQSRAVIGLFEHERERAAARHFEAKFGNVASVDFTDGARITFASGDIVHLRPSGNAPEFRCYTEADSAERAKELNDTALHVVRSSLLSWTPLAPALSGQNPV